MTTFNHPLKPLIFILISTCLLLTAFPAAGTVYKMTGILTAVNLDYQTAVIEVPRKDDKTFTVAGPLDKDARLIRDGNEVSLKEFKTGERVTVKWHSTEQGHVIDRITANPR